MTSRIGGLLRRLTALLPLLLALELSNAPNLIAQVLAVDEVDCCGAECQDAPIGQKCPPRCSTCACPLGQLAMPAETSRVPPQAPPSILQPMAPSHAIQDPDRERIFHPPRA